MTSWWNRARRSRYHPLLVCGVLIAAVVPLVSGKQAEAMITKIILKSVQSPAFGERISLRSLLLIGAEQTLRRTLDIQLLACLSPMQGRMCYVC